MPPQQFPKEAAAPQQQPCLGLDGPAQLIQRSGAQCPSPALPGSLPGPVGSCVTWGLRQSCVARTAPGDGWQTEGHRLPGDPSLPVQLPLLRSAFPVSCGRAAIGGCHGPSEGRRGCGAVPWDLWYCGNSHPIPNKQPLLPHHTRNTTSLSEAKVWGRVLVHLWWGQLWWGIPSRATD